MHITKDILQPIFTHIRVTINVLLANDLTEQTLSSTVFQGKCAFLLLLKSDIFSLVVAMTH